jgi:hypothetical protein
MPLWLDKPPAIIIPRPPSIQRASLPGIVPVFNLARAAVPTSFGHSVTSSGGRSSLTMTTTAPIVAGALAIVAIFGNTGNGAYTTNSVSDGINTYSMAIGGISFNGNYANLKFAYKANAAAVPSGSTLSIAFQPTMTGDTIHVATAQIPSYSTFDKTNQNTGAIGIPTGTLSTAKEVIFGFAANVGAGGGAYAGASGFTNLSTDGGLNYSSSPQYSALDYKLVTSTASITYTPTWASNSSNLASLLATFS